jgi:plasmid maintenance system antidote protein VapI
MYEFKPDYAVPPRYTLLECLKEKNVSISDFAIEIDMDLDELMSVIDGHTPISKEIAEKFADYFSLEGEEGDRGMNVSFWLNLQNNYAKTLYRLCCEKAGLRNNLFAHFSDEELEALSVLINSDIGSDDDTIKSKMQFLDKQFGEEWQRRAWGD